MNQTASAARIAGAVALAVMGLPACESASNPQAEADFVAVSLTLNGGAAVPAGGGEVSLWCQSQGGATVKQAQMMMIQVGSFS